MSKNLFIIQFFSASGWSGGWKLNQEIKTWCPSQVFWLCQKIMKSTYFCWCQRIYHVGHTSSHSNTEVKQHWAWILLGWETLQGIPGSAGIYPPLPPADRVQSFQTLFVSIKWLGPAETKKKHIFVKLGFSVSKVTDKKSSWILIY
jgi:hypothetical protein